MQRRLQISLLGLRVSSRRPFNAAIRNFERSYLVGAASGMATFKRMCFSCQSAVILRRPGDPAVTVMSCKNVEFENDFSLANRLHGPLDERPCPPCPDPNDPSKSSSMFHASHCLGLSRNACRRLPQIESWARPYRFPPVPAFRSYPFVQQTGHATRFCIHLQPYELILQCVF
jgi:hypothetical protein